MEVVNIDTNRKIFILTYGTPLMVVIPLQSYLVTLPDTTSAEKLLSVKYSLPVYFGENVEVTLKIIQQLSDKVKSVELSISIST